MGIIMPGTGLPRPGRMLYGENYHLRPTGGAANLAVAAKRAGAKEVTLFAAVGQDEFGQKLRAHLETQKINMDYVITHNGPTALVHSAVIQGGYFQSAVALGVATNLKTEPLVSMVAAGDHVMADVVANHRASYAVLDQIASKGAKTFVYYEHGWPPPPPEILKTLQWMVTDPVGVQDVLKTNTEITEEVIRDWAPGFVEEFGLNLAVQMSPSETLVFTKHGNWRWKGLRTEPLDYSGAPEAWLGTLVTALSMGLPEQRALARATAASSLATLALGPQDAMVQTQTLAEWLPDLPEPEQLS